MIKIYESVTSIVLNGKKIECSHSYPYFEDESKINECKHSFNLTWDNIEEYYNKLPLPFDLWKVRNNYKITFYAGYGLIDTFNCHSIKQKKTKELNIQVLITPVEVTDISLEQIFKIRDSEMAIKYFKERGLNICPLQK